MASTEHGGRRSFMKLLGGLLGAGAGLAITGSASAAPSSNDAGVNGCAIFCYKTTTNCESCGTGRRWFRCVNSCDGSVFYSCQTRSCAGFCLSQSAC